MRWVKDPPRDAFYNVPLRISNTFTVHAHMHLCARGLQMYKLRGCAWKMQNFIATIHQEQSELVLIWLVSTPVLPASRGVNVNVNKYCFLIRHLFLCDGHFERHALIMSMSRFIGACRTHTLLQQNSAKLPTWHRTNITEFLWRRGNRYYNLFADVWKKENWVRCLLTSRRLA